MSMKDKKYLVDSNIIIYHLNNEPIAATTQVYDLILVTRNTKDFSQIDIKILNPFINKES